MQGVVVDGCVRKFRSPDSILIVVAGGDEAISVSAKIASLHSQ